MSGRRFVVLGAGGHARVVISTLRAAGCEAVAAYEDGGDRERLDGVEVRRPLARADDDVETGWGAVIAIGDNATRRRLAGELDLPWASVVHPTAWIDPGVEIGAGTVIFAGAVVQPGSRIGRHVIVNTAASVDHDGEVGDFVHLAPGVRLAGTVTIGEGAFVGIGAAVVPRRRIGDWAVVGAGGVVIEDVPAESVAVGVPARPR